MEISYIVILIIIIVKAIFSMGDTAFLFLNKYKFQQLSRRNQKKNIRINKLLQNKNKLFGTVRVGMTMCEIFASAYAAEAFMDPVSKWFDFLPLGRTALYVISVIVLSFIVSYLTLVFGELLPKKIARNHPEKTAYAIINLLSFVSILIFPFEKIINFSEKFFSRLLGIPDEREEHLTEKEIKLIIAEGKDQGIIDKSEKNLLYNVLKFDDLILKQIMIPKERIKCVNIDAKVSTIFNEITKNQYTRMPVYSKNKDNIIGIINIKDIALKYAEDPHEEIDIRSCIREPFFVLKDTKVSVLFEEMQINKKRIAVVKDVYGKVEGLVTMEDIIERIVGNLYDEYDNTKVNVNK